ncbi:MAG: hypothetical protein HRU09_07935 [Oligoflexales bacterium]|nr:hypothetical protein [Oligoflexales bacterium]
MIFTFSIFIASCIFFLIVGYGLLTFTLNRSGSKIDVSCPSVLVSSFLCGMLIFVICIYITPNLSLGFTLSGMFFVIGLISFVLNWKAILARVCFVDLTFLFFLVSVLFTYTQSSTFSMWDGWCFWFPVGKVIYLADTLWSGAGWKLYPDGNFNTSYPKYFPVLAASVAKVVGGWNYITPKIAISFLHVGLLASIFVFNVSLLEKIVLSFCFLLISDNNIYGGYLDAFVAGFFCLGAYPFLTRSTHEKIKVEQKCLVIFLIGTGLNLKSEGWLIALALLLSAIFVHSFSFKVNISYLSVTWRYKIKPYLVLCCICLAPVVIWHVLKKKIGIEEMYHLDLTKTYLAVINGQFNEVMHHVLKYTNANHVKFTIFTLVSVSLLDRDRRLIYLTFLVAFTIYFCAMTVAYVNTPFARVPQIKTSAYRVFWIYRMLPLLVTVRFLFFNFNIAKESIQNLLHSNKVISKIIGRQNVPTS